MNKKDRALVNRAEHEDMDYITPIRSLDVLIFRNLSKKAFGIQFCNRRATKDALVFDLTGSPADIRKGIKYVEYLGITPVYDNRPIMREGRTYNLFVDEGEWVVTRVDIDEETLTESYTCVHEMALLENYDDDFICEEAICEVL